MKQSTFSLFAETYAYPQSILTNGPMILFRESRKAGILAIVLGLFAVIAGWMFGDHIVTMLGGGESALDRFPLFMGPASFVMLYGVVLYFFLLSRIKRGLLSQMEGIHHLEWEVFKRAYDKADGHRIADEKLPRYLGLALTSPRVD